MAIMPLSALKEMSRFIVVVSDGVSKTLTKKFFFLFFFFFLFVSAPCDFIRFQSRMKCISWEERTCILRSTKLNIFTNIHKRVREYLFSYVAFAEADTGLCLYILK